MKNIVYKEGFGILLSNQDLEEIKGGKTLISLTNKLPKNKKDPISLNVSMEDNKIPFEIRYFHDSLKDPEKISIVLNSRILDYPPKEGILHYSFDLSGSENVYIYFPNYPFFDILSG